jgi:glycosyltransferase involved in cell wall biosynthesis
MTDYQREKIIFIHPGLSTFVKADHEILSNKYYVLQYHYHPSKKLLQNVLQQIKLFFWIFRHLVSTRFLFIWFADYHSFLPIFLARIIRKKSYICLGGYDTASIPELDYGSFKNPIRKFCARFSIANATLNLPVCDFLASEAIEKVPGSTVKTLPTGYSAEKFYPANEQKENIILTVAEVDSNQRFRLKGIDFFIKIAQKLPEFNFHMIGMSEQFKQSINSIPNNLKLSNRMGHEKLLQHYQKAKVYAQFSMREGLPNSVCEAMLCECIPVGFDNGGISSAIGDAGFMVYKKNVEETVSILYKAMADTTGIGKRSRIRIVEHFSLEKRRVDLLNIIAEE